MRVSFAALYLILILILQFSTNAAALGTTNSLENDAMAGNRFSTNEWPKTDFGKRNISFDEILSGGPPKDGIPAIDNPIFISTKNAQQWLHDFEPVISVEINHQAKAYPLQILMFHEIVNDVLAARAITITFCPLCNTSMVFLRDVNGKRLDFGTTGRLRNSDLIMYDRQTESWWQQFTGEALIGFYTNTRLTEINSRIIAFKNFRDHYPKGLVLSRETGFKRQYGTNPYRGYDHIDNGPFLMRGSIDNRLPPMERVLSVTIDKQQKLYPFPTLENSPILHDVLDDEPIIILRSGEIFSALDKNTITHSRKIPSYGVFIRRIKNQTLHFQIRNNRLYDKETGSEWDVFGRAIAGKLKNAQLKNVLHGIHFAFAWLAFKPDVEIYMSKKITRE